MGFDANDTPVPGVGAVNALADIAAEGDVAERGPGMTFDFASFFSSFRRFLSSRACADSSISVFTFHYKGQLVKYRRACASSDNHSLLSNPPS